MSEERQMTVGEAVVWITKYCKTKQYINDCYNYWEEHCGKDFVDQVKAGVKKVNGK